MLFKFLRIHKDLRLAQIAWHIDRLGQHNKYSWTLAKDKYTRADELVGEFFKRERYLQRKNRNQGL